MDPSHQGCSLNSFKVADMVSIDSNIQEHKARNHSNSNNTSHDLVLLGSHICLLSSRKIWLPRKCLLEDIYRQLNQHKVSQFNEINQNNLKKALVDVEGAKSIQLISHWFITRMMCPVRHAFVLSDTQNVSDRTKQILNFP